MSECVPRQRDALRPLGEALAAVPSVVGVDLTHDDPTHGVVLDVALSGSGVGPRVCQLVGEHHGRVVDVSPQGDHTSVWVVAES